MANFIDIAKSYAGRLILRYAPPKIKAFIRLLHSKGRYFSKNNVVVNTLPVGRVLIIAPHPDDEAVGMGGTLSIHLGNQSKVTTLYMTDGRHETPSLGISKAEMIDIRRKEAESIGERYHINQIFWKIEDNCLTNDKETISDMSKVLEDVQPEIIYLPSFFDHHYDHFAANKILIDSLKEMSATGITLIGYEVWNNNPFPNYIVDITPYFEKKKEILNHYRTPLKGMDYVKLCRYRNALHYALYINSKRDGYAEAFDRLDFETYQELYNDYLYALRKFGSNLPTHIDKGLL